MKPPARLVAVSNRVGPVRGAAAAGGLAVGLVDALREHGGLWFGWSGRTAAAGRARLHTEDAGGLTMATLDLTQHEFDGYLQRLLQQLPVAAAALPHRPDALRARRARELPQRQRAASRRRSRSC